MFRRTRDTDDFAAEIESHLQLEIDRLQQEGLGPDEAVAAARRAFGNVALSTERFHESQRWMWWDRLVQDVRYALRSWRSAPGLTLVATLTMALAIGATTATFSVVDATLLHPLPYPQSDRLVSIVDDLPGIASYDVGLSQPEWLDLDRSGIFEQVALAWFDENNLTGASRPAQVRLMSVTPNYFAMLGVAPELGRTFPAADRSPGYLGEVVISDGLWKGDFGGDPHILDKSIRLDTDLYRVVGIMPPGFHAPGRTVDERNVDVWAATSFYGPPLPQQPLRGVRNVPGAIARLTPGLTSAAAQSRIDALVAELQRRFPGDYPDRSGWTVRLVPLQDTVVGDMRRSLILMLCAVGLVLLIGCVNVANLLLARASTRRREFAVRQAIGAGANRLMRQVLTESLCLSMIGGAAGIAFLFVAKASLVRLIPEGLPHLNDITLNWNVLLFAVLVTVASGVVFGCAPAIAARRPAVMPTMQMSSRGETGTRSQARTRSALVIAECALSIVLMIAAVLLLRSFRDLVNVRLGFEPASVMTVRTRLPYPNDVTIDKYPSAQKEAPFLRELLRRTQAIPGVELAAIGSSSAIPLDHADRDVNTMWLLVEGRGVDVAQAPVVNGSVVTPEYFQLLGMTAIRGRLFTNFDTETTAPVAVVNEAMARTFWPDGDPIGAHVKLTRSATAWTTIVGVLADARTETLADAGIPQIYASAYQKTSKHLAVFLRGPLDIATTGERVREIVQSIDPTLPVFRANSLTNLVSASLAARRFAMQIIGLFALTALLLAALGIYGVMSYTLTARTQEIGIRLALGAPRERMFAEIVGRGLMLAIVGTVVGVIGAAIVARLMTGVLYGVNPIDPMTFAAVPLALVAVAALACGIPASRALRIEPLLALRCE
ncbi:MAG TPA: ABC transporter permease [Vicinamibacterales bacterium]|jgi:putative ABC transport system permease protein